MYENEKNIIEKRNVFIKFSCGRNMPLLLQATRCAVETGYQSEVDFYNLLARDSGMCTPFPIYVDGHYWCNRVCISLDLVDGIVTPDYKGK